MTALSPRIGAISLAEAGNLGDDLIIVALTRAILSSCPDADLSFLSFGERLDWSALAAQMKLASVPEARTVRRDYPFSRSRESLLADREIIFFGGGGLLQTSHHNDRPYHWLGFLPSGRRNPRAIAVGLGLGPLSEEWTGKLKRMGSPFDAAYVRDQKSLELASNKLNWPAERCRDFIDDEFLSLIVPRARKKSQDRMGIALRAWPGYSPLEAATHIRHVADRHSIGDVTLFVLESKHGQGPDVDFARAVREQLSGLETTLEVYEAKNMIQFVRSITDCSVAISMKLHASALWAFREVPVYPVIYAPKMAAFYGLEYNGLSVIDSLMAPAKEEGIPRADEVVRSVLAGLTDPPLLGEGSRFGRMSRLRYQIAGTVTVVGRRLGTSTMGRTRTG